MNKSNTVVVRKIISSNPTSKLSHVSLAYQLFLDLIDRKSPYPHKPVMLGGAKVHEYQVGNVSIYRRITKKDGQFSSTFGMKTADAKKCLQSSVAEFAW